MPQMPVAFGAAHLDTDHAVRGVAIFCDRIGTYRLCEARPARAAVIFVGRTEQLSPAPAAVEFAFAFLKVQRATEGPLGACFAQHMILHRGKARTPFVFAKFQFVHKPNVCLARAKVKAAQMAILHPKLTTFRENRGKCIGS